MKETMGQIIRRLRKCNDWTQEDLAGRLAVSSKVISKWESDRGAPDALMLPVIADVFGVYIDNLYGRIVETEPHFDLCTEFPWKDDGVMREVTCNGRKIIKVKTIG